MVYDSSVRLTLCRQPLREEFLEEVGVMALGNIRVTPTAQVGTKHIGNQYSTLKGDERCVLHATNELYETGGLTVVLGEVNS